MSYVKTVCVEDVLPEMIWYAVLGFINYSPEGTNVTQGTFFVDEYNTGDVLSRSNQLASRKVRECSKRTFSAKTKEILSLLYSTVFRPPQPANATAPLSSGRTVF